MGGGASSNHAESSERTVAAWKIVPNEDDARALYEDQGTLAKGASKDQLEFRTLLDDPVAMSLLQSFAKTRNCLQLLTIWIDIRNLQIQCSGVDSIPSLHLFLMSCEMILQKLKLQDALNDTIGVTVDFLHFTRQSLNHLEEMVHNEDTQYFTEVWNLMERFKVVHQTALTTLTTNVFLPFKLSTSYPLLNKKLRTEYNKIVPDDFEYLGKLGTGAFGVVLKCRKKSTGAILAMKVQRKKAMLETYADKPWRIDDEKKAYAVCHHPFIIEFAYAFQTASLAMIVMNLCTCGDLRSLLLEQPRERFTNETAHFYSAELVSALTYLHSRGLVYRDLKPGNVLLHESGHIKLVDLGTAIDISGLTIEQNEDLTQAAPAAFDKINSRSYNSTRNLSHNTMPSSGGPMAATAAGGGSVGGGTFSNHPSFNVLGHTSYNSYYAEGRSILDSSMSIYESDAPEGADDDVIALGGEGEGEGEGGGNLVGVYPSAAPKKVRAKSIVGTVGYMAPEVVVMLKIPGSLRKGYSYAVDWWSLGATIYKMYTGARPYGSRSRFYGHCYHETNSQGRVPKGDKTPPVEGASQDETAATEENPAGPNLGMTSNGGSKKNSGGMKEVSSSGLMRRRNPGYYRGTPGGELLFDPTLFPIEAEDLIRKLLCFDPDQRLGCGPRSSMEVVEHPYYARVDWAFLEQQGYKPPMLPSVCEPHKSMKADKVSTFEEALEAAGNKSWLLDANETSPSGDSSFTISQHPFINNFTEWDYVAPARVLDEILAAAK